MSEFDSSPRLRALDGIEWPSVVGEIWEQHREPLATPWAELSEHDQASIFKALKAQEPVPPGLVAPVQTPPRDTTPTHLRSRTYGNEVDPSTHSDETFFVLPRHEAEKFVAMYNGFDDWCGLGIKAVVEIIDASDVPEDEDAEYFHSTYDAAGDLMFEERG